MSISFCLPHADVFRAFMMFSDLMLCWLCVCCCCLPTPMALASGGSPMFPLVVQECVEEMMCVVCVDVTEGA